MKWINHFPVEMREFWQDTAQLIDEIQEIRIRAEKPVILYRNGQEWYPDEKGRLGEQIEGAALFTYEKIQRLVDYWCQDSRYAYQKQLQEGYLTMWGGHRVGICGEAVLNGEGEVETIKNIGGLNLRIAHEEKWVGERLAPHLYEEGQFQNTLLISPPGAGKTTMLRDLVRRISNGENGLNGKNVGLVDERGEIASCFQGVPQLDVGARTDVLTGCSKAKGMIRLLRSMGPQVIAVDELGSEEDTKAIGQILGCGCSVLATIHGSNYSGLVRKKHLTGLWEGEAFTRIIVMKKEGGSFQWELYRNGDVRPCCTS